MTKPAVCIALVIASACGRRGFDAIDGIDGTAGLGDDANSTGVPDDGAVPTGTCFTGQVRVTQIAPLATRYPKLVVSPSGYVVLWYDLAGASYSFMLQRIANLSLDGQAVTLIVDAIATNIGIVDVGGAWTVVGGEHYASGNDDDLTVMRVDQTTSAVTATHRVGITNRIDVQPTIAWTGTDYGLVWLNSNALQLMYRRLTSALADASNDILLDGSALGQARMIWNATAGEHVVVFTAEPMEPGTTVTQRIAQDGTLPAGQTTIRGSARISQGIASLPTGYVVSYADNTETGLAYVAGATTFHKLADAGTSATLVWTGSELGAVYQTGFSPGPFQLVLQRLDASLNLIGAPVPIRNALTSYPTVVYANGRYAITWQENEDVYFAELCAL